MKVLVSGANGFIGRAFCRAAVQRGHGLLALCRKPSAALPPETQLAIGDLADTPWKQVERFAPDAVLHLAWITAPERYLFSPENETWLIESKAWLGQCHAMGIPHIAGTGTCIEYASSHGPLNESISPLAPVVPYSKAKVALLEWLQCEAVVPSSWAWFRIFYPYGPGEHPDRLGSSLVRELRSGRSLSLRTPHSVKDYIFVDDAAMAICLALETRMSGAINVGTGNGTSIQDFANHLAGLLDADPSLVRQASDPKVDPAPHVVADAGRLRSLGWAPQTSLKSGLQQLIHSLTALPQ